MRGQDGETTTTAHMSEATQIRANLKKKVSSTVSFGHQYRLRLAVHKILRPVGRSTVVTISNNLC